MKALMNLSIKKKLVAMGLWGVVLLSVIVVVVTLVAQRWVLQESEKALRAQMEESTARIALDVYNMVATQDKLLRVKLEGDLAVARDLLAREGEMSLAEETVAWKAVNQFSRKETDLTLPVMMAGKLALRQNRQKDVESPVVDKVRSLVGGTCTLFQRVNPQGDMLRVSTNVMLENGERAIGTFIPATHADGTADPVIASVLKGETYTGRAFVVNAWYIAAYEPIRSAKGDIIGMLYVGVPMDSFAQREAIMKTPVGKTGYVYVIGGSGAQQGKYIISQNGKRDGENIWQAKDSNGRFFIQDIVNKAMAKKDGGCDFVYYPWKNAGDKDARVKVAAVTYYEPWDWVIGAGAYEDELLESLDRLTASFQKAKWMGAPIMLVMFLLTGGVGIWLSRSISLPLGRASDQLRQMADGDFTKHASPEDIARGDELGELARSAETLNQNMHQIIRDISLGIETLAASSNELSGISGDRKSVV